MVVLRTGVLCLLVANASLAQEPTSPQLDWVRANAVKLDTCDPSAPLTDLLPLKAMIGNARIVALGEPTHGTREAFRMKHRLLEFLVREMGFSIFSIEANMPEAYRLDDYVKSGRGDPYDLIQGMYFWTWDTAEVHDMVEWMRSYNREHPEGPTTRERLSFTGFDMQYSRVAAPIVLSFARQRVPDLVERVQSGAKLAANMDDQTGASSFGVATGTFPVDAARGKKLTMRGWVRTRDVKGGWGGLWGRVDGPSGVLAFDNMADRGPHDTTGWQEFTIALDVPRIATNINFGMILIGSGEAWFDSVRFDLDGQPAGVPGVDLAFEGDRLDGFFASKDNFVASIDKGEKHDGTGSAVIRGSPADAGAAAHAYAEWKAIRSQLESRRGELAAAVSGEELDWAIQNARVVEQDMEMRNAPAGSPGDVRDRSMAENIRWILGQSPDAKIVLWAHNGHVARTPGSMGSYLDAMFPGRMVVVGFATGEGRYRAISNKGKGLGEWDLEPPPQGSLEYVLKDVGTPISLLDVRRASKNTPGSEWLLSPMPMRSVGAMEMDRQFFPVNVRDAYDLIVWIERTTPAKALARPAAP